MSDQPKGQQPPFVCTHCDHVFAPPPAGEAPRCPKCLRKTGLLRPGVDSGPELEPSTSPAVTRSLIFGLVLVAAGAVAWFTFLGPMIQGGSDSSEGGGEGASSSGSVAAAPEGACFAVTDSVQSLADSISVDGARGDLLATKLSEGLQRLERDGKLRREPTSDVPLEGPPRSADALATAIAGGTAPVVTPYEMGCLLYAIAQARGVEAEPAESKKAQNAQTTLRRKSFGIRVGGDGGRYFDPYLGISDAAVESVALTGEQFQAYGLGLAAAFHLQKGDRKSAATLTRDAQKLWPESAALILLSGMIKVASGMTDLGIEEIAKAVKAAPDAMGYYNLGMAYAQSSGFFKAFQSLKKAVEIDDEFAMGYLALGNLQIQRLGMMPEEKRAGAIEEIQGYFGRAKELDATLDGLAVSQAQLLLLTDEADEAVELLEAALKREPQSPDLNLMLGQIELQSDEPEKALSHLEIGADGKLARGETEGDVRELLNLAYASTGEWERAIGTYTKWVAAYPEIEDLRLGLAGAYRQAEEPDKAMATLRAQIEAFPKDAVAPLLLAQLGLDTEKWDLAAEMARKSQSIKMSFEASIIEYLALYADGQIEPALAVIDKESKRRDNAFGQAAQALLEQAEVEPAKPILVEAVKRKPDDVENAVLLYMTHLVLDEAAEADAVRASTLGQAGEDKKEEWEGKFDEAKRQVDAMVQGQPSP